MQRFSRIVAASPAAALLLAAPASAATSNHGVLTGGEFPCDTTEVDGPDVTGSWSLTIDRRSRTSDSSQDQRKPNGGLHIRVVYDGVPYLSIATDDLVFQSLEGGVYTFTAFGRVGPSPSTPTPGHSRGTSSWGAVARRTGRTTP